MKWNKKIISVVSIFVSFAFLIVIIIQILLLSLAVRQRFKIFENNVNGALNSIVQKLETEEILNRILRISVETDSSGSYSTTTMHVIDQDESAENKKLVLKNMSQFKSEVHIDSNKIILHLRTQRHIRLYTLDENKKEQEKVFDDFRAPGIHEIPIDHLSHSQFTYFNLYIDESPYPFYLDKSSPGRLVIDPELDQTRRAMIDKVIEQYLVFEPMPIEQRLDFSALDSVIQGTLKEYGILHPVTYGILSQKDSVLLVNAKADTNRLKKSEFRTRLFPHDVYVEPNDLVLQFPKIKRVLLGQLGLFSGITFFLIVAIIICFSLAIRAIVIQTRLSKLLTDFINNMTHEFKTPLSTIAIASESIGKENLLSDQKQLARYGSIISEESARMRKQVEKILEMVALEQGDFTLTFEKADLNTLVEEAIEHFKLNIEKLNGSLITNLQAQKSCSEIDQVHIMNCFFNVLDNAVKYSVKDPEINIKTENVGHYIKISFCDNGIGLRPEEIKRIFQKYYRVPTGNLHNVKGLGLGLSYVKFIVEAHKGYIEVDSQVDKFTCFSIFLPIINND